MVQVRDLFVEFNGESILQNIDLNVNKGEKLTLTGESGTGKSTLLNVMAGFIPDFRGEVMVNGLLLNPENIQEIRGKIAWLPQNISLNVDQVCDLFYAPFELEINKSKKPSKDAVQHIFDVFEISKVLLEKKIDEISGGQKQRILLASSILLNKPLLLLDEPTSALDQQIKEKITDYIFQQKDITMMAVTHDEYWIDQSDKILNLEEIRKT